MMPITVQTAALCPTLEEMNAPRQNQSSLPAAGDATTREGRQQQTEQTVSCGWVDGAMDFWTIFPGLVTLQFSRVNS